MDRFQEAERLAAEGGLSFAEAMRMLAGADVTKDAVATSADPEWSRVVAGPWLAETLKGLRSPGGLDEGRSRCATCTARCGPTSRSASAGCTCSRSLGLGACLADDMGLGKTIQVLALLLVHAARAGRQAAAEPAGGAGLAARQLGGGDRALRAEAQGPDRASVGDAGRAS